MGSFVATHQKTQQGLKPVYLTARTKKRIVATHQKTQQGLKLEDTTTRKNRLTGRNASENPAGIETSQGQKKGCAHKESQRIRKPSRD